MDITEFIRVELLVLVPVLIAIGAMLKGYERINNAWIPFIITGLGILFAVVYMLVFPQELTIPQTIVTGIIQGVLCATIAVYGHQISKQVKDIHTQGKK